jgi:hypothetical protein
MLHWYRSLIDLRKRYVINGERTCKAELIDGVIQMQVPADRPVVKIFARIEGAAELPNPGAEWKQALAEEADGFAVSVYIRSDF